MMQFETVIGLEVHVELSTKSKIFCGCSTEFGHEPNTQCCPVCTGMPGTLPVLNRQVVNYAILAGLATDCKITELTKFDRKNFFYPDMPKAYQVSQLYLPICREGHVDIITADGSGKRIGIHEIHMEEDAGKLIHDPWDDCTLIDFNRCGVPLLEIVSDPDLRSSEDAILYINKLRSILQYLGISDCKMEEGSFRVDVNLSVRHINHTEFGTRTEMKNMNSLKAIARAIEKESLRQIELISEGHKIKQETRRWDENKDASFAMRSKENAQDYRYFPEPDLLPCFISSEWIDTLRKSLPELPDDKISRYRTEFLLPELDIQIITSNRKLSKLFEETVSFGISPKETANRIMSDLLKLLNESMILPDDMEISSYTFYSLIKMNIEGRINRNGYKTILAELILAPVDLEKFVSDHDLEIVNDENDMAETVKEILTQNPQSIADYLGGKEKAMLYLIGQVMKRTKGKADPTIVTRLLAEEMAKFS